MLIKKNNRGFTLVELIIVVAIIAVLATLLVPQYLQYVEETRETTDLQTASTIMNATRLTILDYAISSTDTHDMYVVHWRTDFKNITPNLPNFVVLGKTDSGSFVETAGAKAFRDDIAATLGWLGDDGVLDRENAVSYGLSQISLSNRFAFYIDATTGHIEISEHFSGKWLDNIIRDGQYSTVKDSGGVYPSS